MLGIVIGIAMKMVILIFTREHMAQPPRTVPGEA